jgi:hypothetical protein
MTQAPANDQFIDLELSPEEQAAVTATAQSVGLDLDTYVRLRVVSAGALPEPAAVFELFRRQAQFAENYTALVKSYAAGGPENLPQIDALSADFAALLEDWDALHGSR